MVQLCISKQYRQTWRVPFQHLQGLPRSISPRIESTGNPNGQGMLGLLKSRHLGKGDPLSGAYSLETGLAQFEPNIGSQEHFFVGGAINVN